MTVVVRIIRRRPSFPERTYPPDSLVSSVFLGLPICRLYNVRICPAYHMCMYVPYKCMWDTCKGCTYKCVCCTWYICTYKLVWYVCTVEPLLKDTHNKGHHKYYLDITSLQRTCSKEPKIDFPIVLIHFHLWRVDNLSTVDKLACSNVSFIERSHFTCAVFTSSQYKYICVFCTCNIHTFVHTGV